MALFPFYIHRINFLFYWEDYTKYNKGNLSLPVKFSLHFLAKLFFISFQDFDENSFVEKRRRC